MRVTEIDPLSVVGCRVCGWTVMDGFDLCVGCLDIKEWSRVNRAFCEFFHRGMLPARIGGGPDPDREALDDDHFAAITYTIPADRSSAMVSVG